MTLTTVCLKFSLIILFEFKLFVVEDVEFLLCFR